MRLSLSGRHLAFSCLSVLLAAGAEPRLPPAVERPVDFIKDVQPLLATACYSCHGPNKQKGDLRFDRKESALRPEVVVAGKSANSPMIQRVAGLDANTKMPPKGPALTAKQVGLLRAWIDQGARWPQAADTLREVAGHWAYRPLVRPAIPTVKHTAWVRNPIDAFVLARLEAQDMTPSALADRQTLLRRVTFDLLGLPPTSEETDAFLADASPEAYEKVVDRLLASPHHGERWARHWMDVVHFAETHGHDQDAPRENAWPYRDYLIRAFNDDRPYARFVAEQVAGDVLFSEDPQAIAATGMLAAGPWDESSQKDIRDDTLDKKVAQNLDRDDIVTTVLSAFSSTTIHCARCHNHKFDPITQEEYYGLQAVFAGIDRANRPYDPDPEVAHSRVELLQRRKELDIAAALAAELEGITAAGHAKPALHVLRDQVDSQLVALPPQQFVYAGTPEFQAQGSFKPAAGGCRPIHVLRRGDVSQPSTPALPGALSCVGGLNWHFKVADEGARRAALARWLGHHDNILTWRSIVNRVWHYHFGRGIAASPGDLGRMGARPTHPELLDWLAVWFRDDAGGSLKWLHRLIVTSAAYTQSSAHRPEYFTRDGDNLLLWRMNRGRLDAESLRDAVLAVSGKLDRKMGGPSVKHFVQGPGIHVTPTVDYLAFDVDGPGAYRRSVYRFLFRTLPDPFMDVLDCPDASQFTPARASSVTALQALALLNDRFLVRQSEHFAARVAAAGDLQSQVQRAFLLALGRPPQEKEAAALTSYAARHGMANVCRLLLNTSEFLFVP
jgi:hypothetical protein